MTEMLAGFALYVEPAMRPDQCVVGTAPGTRLMRMIRLPRGWRLWLSTNDFIFGTYLELFDDGRILRCTVRKDEGDEYFWVRPSDDAIRNRRY